LKAGAQSRNTPAHASGQGITDGWQAVDIGRETIAQYKVEIGKAKTILWNGPVGIFENSGFRDRHERISRGPGGIQYENHYWRRRLGDRG